MAIQEGHQGQDRVILSGPPALLQLQAGMPGLAAWRELLSDLMRSWIPVLSLFDAFEPLIKGGYQEAR